MADKVYGRSASVIVVYNNTDITANISGDIESFDYSDAAESQSDSISLTLDAQESKWVESWFPEKGAKLEPAIAVRDWNVGGIKTGYRNYSAECGSFVLDDLSYSADPDTLTIGAVAKPSDTSFSERNREFTWKNTSVQKIAEEIAARYSLELKFEGDDHSIDALEQDDPDSTFLEDLCETYGLIIKVYASKLWVYDREQYKKKDAAYTVYRKMPAENTTALCAEPGSFSWNTTLSGTYTGGIFTYTKKASKKSESDINISVTVGTDERQLKMSEKVSSEADAKARLIAEIRNKNHGATSASFTVIGYPAGASAQCINLSGWGSNIDGKYFVDEMKHSFSRSGGYKTKIKCSRVEELEL